MTPEQIAALQAIAPSLTVQGVMLIVGWLAMKGSIRFPREVQALEKQLEREQKRNERLEEIAWKAVASGQVLADAVEKKDKNA